MKRLLGLLLVLLVLPACATFAQSEELLYDGLLQVASMQRKVRDVVEVNRSPLFDNAPFLRLREKDKLVKAREFREAGKPAADPDRISYYLLSGGVYYQLWMQEENGKVLLSPAFYGADACLLFDWDLTLDTARSLRKILPQAYTGSITRKQYDKIVSLVREKFPEIDIGWEGANPSWQPERILSIPGQAVVEFQGLSYASFENCFYKYSVRIGPSVCSIVGQKILQGPRHVERREFEREVIDGPNGSPGEDVDPKIAKIKKAEYDRMMRFQKLVRDVLQK